MWWGFARIRKSAIVQFSDPAGDQAPNAPQASLPPGIQDTRDHADDCDCPDCFSQLSKPDFSLAPGQPGYLQPQDGPARRRKRP